MNWWDWGLRKPKPGTGTSDMIPLANTGYNLFTRTTDLVHMHHFAVALRSEAVTNQYSSLLIKVDVWDHRLCVSHIVISITSLKQYNVTKSGCRLVSSPAPDWVSTEARLYEAQHRHCRYPRTFTGWRGSDTPTLGVPATEPESVPAAPVYQGPRLSALHWHHAALGCTDIYTVRSNSSAVALPQ